MGKDSDRASDGVQWAGCGCGCVSACLSLDLTIFTESNLDITFLVCRIGPFVFVLGTGIVPLLILPTSSIEIIYFAADHCFKFTNVS